MYADKDSNLISDVSVFLAQLNFRVCSAELAKSQFGVVVFGITIVEVTVNLVTVDCMYICLQH